MSAVSIRLRAPAARVRALLEAPQAPYVALGAMMLLALALMLYAGRGIGFVGDEWDFLLHRQGWTPDVFLMSHNEHLVILQVLVYKALFSTVGIGSNFPYKLVQLGVYLASAGVLFTYARPRIGHWAALIPTALLLFLGAGWEDTLLAFQMGFVASLAFGLGAYIALDRKRDGWALALLLLSICSSGLGLPVAAGIAVRLVLSRRWRALWIVAIPIVLWFAWDLHYGDRSLITSDSLLHTPQWTLDAAAGAIAGLGGLSIEWGRVGLLALVVAIVFGLRRDRERMPAILGLLTIIVSFWLLTGSGRSLNTPPDQSRYVYVGAFWILALLAELASGIRPTRTQMSVATLVTLFLIAGNMAPLRANAAAERNRTTVINVELTSFAIARDSINPNTQWFYIKVGSYLKLLDDGRNPAYTEDQLAAKSPSTRSRADATILPLEGAALVPAGPGFCPPARAVANTQAEVPLPAGGLRITAGAAPVSVSVRRFAPAPDYFPVGVVDPHATRRFKLPADRSRRPWFVHFASASPAKVCGLRR